MRSLALAFAASLAALRRSSLYGAVRRKEKRPFAISNSMQPVSGSVSVWQHGEGIVTFKKHGILGNRMRCLICRRCGAVLFQWVAEPHRFPPIR
jgi:hypothetical protein